MPTINGENLVPRGQGGAAYILGANTPSALSVLVNGQRSRDLAAQRAAAAQAKAAADDYKDWNSRLAGLNNTTGPTYQRYASEQRTVLGTKLQAIYADPKLARQEKSFQANDLIDQTQISLAAGKQIDDQNAKIKVDYGNDKEINQEKFWQDVHAAQFQKDPTTGMPDVTKPIAPLDYDQTTPERLLQDRKYLNPSVLYKNFATTLAPKQTTQQAVGGKPGTMSTTYSNEVRLWKRNADGSPYRNKNGDMELDINDNLLESALGNERIKRDLQGVMTDHNALTKSGEAKMAAYEPLLPEERAALEVDPTMKDLLGRRLTEFALANHRETQRYNRYPRPVVSKAATEIPYQAPSFDGAPNRYDMPNDGPIAVQGYGGLGQPAPGIKDLTNSSYTGPIKRTDYAVYGTYGASPVDVSKAGKTTNKHVDSFSDKGEFDIMGAEGQREHRIGDMQSMSGYPGKPVGAYVDAKTGKQIYPTSNKIGDEMVGAGTAKLQVQFDFASEKGENFNPTNMKATTAALLNETDNSGRPKYPTPELAAAAARKVLATSTVRSTHLRSRENYLDVDRLFGSSYAKHQALLDRETQRLRAEYANRQQPPAATATKPKDATGGAYPRKATTPANQNKDTKPGRAGAY